MQCLQNSRNIESPYEIPLDVPSCLGPFDRHGQDAKSGVSLVKNKQTNNSYASRGCGASLWLALEIQILMRTEATSDAETRAMPVLIFLPHNRVPETWSAGNTSGADSCRPPRTLYLSRCISRAAASLFPLASVPCLNRSGRRFTCRLGEIQFKFPQVLFYQT